MDGSEIISYLAAPASIICIIISISEIVKSFLVEAKFIPVVDLILGMLFGICVYGFGLNYGIWQGALIGIALGLSSCGLFSGFKNLFM